MKLQGLFFDKESESGGGNVNTEEKIEIREDGTIPVLVRDKEGNELEVTYFENEEGEMVYDVPEDTDEELINALESRINETAAQVGSFLKKNKELKEVVPTLQKTIADKDEEIARLKTQLQQAQGRHKMTDEDAQKFWGVATVQEVKEMMEDDFASYNSGQAQYAAQFATPAKPVEEKKPDNTIKRYQQPAPKAINGGGGGTNAKPPKAKSLERQVNEFLAGASQS